MSLQLLYGKIAEQPKDHLHKALEKINIIKHFVPLFEWKILLCQYIIYMCLKNLPEALDNLEQSFIMAKQQYITDYSEHYLEICKFIYVFTRCTINIENTHQLNHIRYRIYSLQENIIKSYDSQTKNENSEKNMKAAQIYTLAMINSLSIMVENKYANL